MRVTNIGSRTKPIPGPTHNVVLEIPFPPSLNHCYPTNKNGHRYRSPEYDAWLTQAGWELKQQKARPIIGPVEISIQFKERGRHCDIDNRIKPVLDLLVKCGIIDGDDDRTVKKVSAEWRGESRARVEIIRAERVAA